MKRIILFSMLVLVKFGVSQTGIETTSPTETLHVNGTARITDLPADETVNAINTNENGELAVSKQTFKATKTVVADDQGVLGTIDVVNTHITPLKTRCYVSTTTDFSEVDTNGVATETNGVALVEFDDFSFKFVLNNLTASNNFIFIKNTTGVNLYGITKGPNDIGLSFSEMPNGQWVRMSENIRWDSENSGELLFWTHFDDNNNANTPNNPEPHYYSIRYFGQKRVSTSYPSVCLNVAELN